MIVPADDSPTCGVVIHYASPKVIALYGKSMLVRWREGGKDHYGLSPGGGVRAGDMRTVHLPEQAQRIEQEMKARLPLFDAKHRMPRIDLRTAHA